MAVRNITFPHYFSKGSYVSDAEQWYAIDDVVVSDTVIPEDYVIGGDVIAPAASSGLSVQ